MRSKKYTLGEQYSALKVNYPQFDTKLRKGQISVTGVIKPTARSVSYSFSLTYRLTKRPKVKILNPVLTKNFKGDPIPHVYPGDELCLYYPKFDEFNSTRLISDSIVPWTSLWLYHYENWHITGTWQGGGKHPKPKKKRY